MIASAGTAPKISDARHSQRACSAGSAKYSPNTIRKHTDDAAYHIGHHAASRDALLPRPPNFENSARNAIATGRSMPTPSPITKRAAISTSTFGASPATIAATTKQSMSAMNTR
ncbi:Uncharacterised protein [Burkholderia mallei]|nr:hypothetical protein DM51_4838 [Burkholderia mallei]KGR92542.1 hypothetical protein X948_5911 [Burkholderia pseudomallei MSHR5608]AJX67424.1 hypothetical protein BM94_4689 [Burkholderia mallei]AJY36701.1 hypothetical protein BO07_4111 [Burkholderia mallei]KIY06254.1 hypothetical protein DM79_A1747 [Burkholderia mallei]